MIIVQILTTYAYENISAKYPISNAPIGLTIVPMKNTENVSSNDN